MSGVVIESSSTTTLSLHPLVLINISDQYTRAKVAGKDKNPRVIGAVCGIQRGRHIEIYSSFELVYTIEDGTVEVDQEYLTTRKDLFAQVFPNYDILGWYSTQTQPTAADFDINSQFSDVNESPLLLLLDPEAATPDAKELPVYIYEQEVKVVEGAPKSFFSRLKYTIETGESERVAVDHIANVKAIVEGDTVLASHLDGVANAIQMLSQRILTIQKFLDQTQKGKIEKDHHILRQINSMINMLPAIDTQSFNQEFLHSYNDTLLVTYLASITKGAQQASELLEKFNTVHEKHRARRGFF